MMSPKSKAWLRRCGWIEVKSESHAYQLIRRELKLRSRFRDRNPKASAVYSDILDIKPGMWVKLVRSSPHNVRTVMFWRY